MTPFVRRQGSIQAVVNAPLKSVPQDAWWISVTLCWLPNEDNNNMIIIIIIIIVIIIMIIDKLTIIQLMTLTIIRMLRIIIIIIIRLMIMIMRLLLPLNLLQGALAGTIGSVLVCFAV